MSQASEILEALKVGITITPYYAFHAYGCLALHSRIAELRSAGYDIECKLHTDGVKRWGEYRLRSA